MFKLPVKLNLKRKKSQQLNNNFFTIDIGTDSVKILAFTKDPTNFSVLGAGKGALEPNAVRAGNILELDAVISAIDNALFKATENVDAEINGAIFGVGEELTTCTVTTVRINRGTNTPINQNDLDAINAKIIDSAYMQAQENILRTTGQQDVELQLITSSTVYSKLDGAEQRDLLGKTGAKIEIAFFTAFIPVYHLDNLKKIASALSLEIYAVAPNLYALGETLKYSNHNRTLDAIIVDIGSDTTEVGVMLGGGIVANKHLSIGGNHFTNAISKETGLNFQEAEKKKIAYIFENLTGQEAMLIERNLNETTDIWLQGLELLFTEFEGVKTFPTKIYLTGGTSKLQLLGDALQTNPWTKSIPFKELPVYTTFEASDLAHVSDTTGALQDREFLNGAALSVVYAELLGNNV